jgi:hypothetical protein
MFNKFDDDMEFKYENILEARGYNYKGSTVVERELKKAEKALQSQMFNLKNREAQVDAELADELDFRDYATATIYHRELEKETNARLRPDKLAYKQAEKHLADVKAKYKTSRNLEVPKASPTLSDDYSSMEKGESEFKPTHGKVTPMDHNYSSYNKLSRLGKELYDTIRDRGNKGKVFEIMKDEMILFQDLPPKELSAIMKLAMDHGYKLDNNVFYWLDDISPSLAKQVDKYDGEGMTHKDIMNASHAFYKKIQNQYLIKYDGDEKKAKEMTKLYRKKKQSESQPMTEAYAQLDEMGGTAGIASDIRQAETRLQYGLLSDLAGGNNTVVMQLIDLVAGIFRKGIKEYRQEGRVPSKDELLNYSNKIYGQDLRKLGKMLQDAADNV